MRDPEIERYGGMAPLTASEQLAERVWKGDPAAVETVLFEAPALGAPSFLDRREGVYDGPLPPLDGLPTPHD